jgi:hypothetical protein
MRVAWLLDRSHVFYLIWPCGLVREAASGKPWTWLAMLLYLQCMARQVFSYLPAGPQLAAACAVCLLALAHQLMGSWPRSNNSMDAVPLKAYDDLLTHIDRSHSTQKETLELSSHRPEQRSTAQQ